MGELDLVHMWNEMGWVAKAIAIILVIMSMISFGVAIERIFGKRRLVMGARGHQIAALESRITAFHC